MKTELSFIPFFLCFLLLIFTTAAVYHTLSYLYSIDFKVSFSTGIILFYEFLLILFTIGYPLMSFYRAEIFSGQLVYSWILFTRKKKIKLTDIEGFYSVLLPSRTAEYMTYYPVSSGRFLPAISSFNFTNSKEFIQQSGLQDLGKLKFSWKFYFKYILIRKKI